MRVAPSRILAHPRLKRRGFVHRDLLFRLRHRGEVRGSLREPTEWHTFLAAIRLNRYDQDGLLPSSPKLNWKLAPSSCANASMIFRPLPRPDVSRRRRPVVGYPALHECAGRPTFHLDRAALLVKGVPHCVGDEFSNNHAHHPAPLRRHLERELQKHKLYVPVFSFERLIESQRLRR